MDRETTVEQDNDGPARQLPTNLYDIHHCRVYSEETPDDGQRNSPKHVEFHTKLNL